MSVLIQDRRLVQEEHDSKRCTCSFGVVGGGTFCMTSHHDGGTRSRDAFLEDLACWLTAYLVSCGSLS